MKGKKRYWILGAAVGGLLVLRVFFFELHEIRGVSMWPGINPSGGSEWILVGKWGEPRVGELAIFRAPDGETVLKRVVAEAGQTVLIRGGDLLVDSRIPPRTPEEILDTACPLWNLSGLEFANLRNRRGWYDALGRLALKPVQGRLGISDDGKFLAIEPEDGRAALRIPAESFRDDHLASSGRMVSGQHVVRDLILTFSLAEASPGTSVRWTQVMRTASPVEQVLVLRVDDKGVDIRQEPGFAGRYDGNLDDVLFRWMLVDDRSRLQILDIDEGQLIQTLPDTPNGASRQPLTDPVECYLTCVTEGASVILGSLDIQRDIHYTPQPADGPGLKEPLPLGPGQFYVLGDNSPESRDSRFWGPLDRSSYVGRPQISVWPWRRAFESP